LPVIDSSQSPPRYSLLVAVPILLTHRYVLLGNIGIAADFDGIKQAPNCQNWLLDYIEKLVAEGYVPNSAISVVRNAPKVL
jgi:hypothetical protein